MLAKNEVSCNISSKLNLWAKNMSDLYKELNEEIKEEALWNNLKKYAPILAVCATVAVASVGFYTWWDYHKINQIYKTGAGYLTAVLKVQANNVADGLKIFQSIEEDGNDYAALAMLNVASYDLHTKKFSEAAKKFQAIASNVNFSQFIRDVSSYYVVVSRLEAGEYGKLEGAITDLEKVNKADATFAPNIRELLLVLYIETKNKNKASELFLQMSTEQALPNSLAERVAQYQRLIAEL